MKNQVLSQSNLPQELQAVPSKTVYTQEAELLKKVTKWLKSLPSNYVYTIRISDKFHRGYSDLFICVSGVLVVAELKDDQGAASEHQKAFIESIECAGGIGGVCRSIYDVYVLVVRAWLQRREEIP